MNVALDGVFKMLIFQLKALILKVLSCFEDIIDIISKEISYSCSQLAPLTAKATMVEEEQEVTRRKMTRAPQFLEKPTREVRMTPIQGAMTGEREPEEEE